MTGGDTFGKLHTEGTPPSKPKVFAREATGLVKSLSLFDMFNVSFGQIMPAVGIVFIVSFMAFAFVGSNVFIGFLIGIPIIGLGPGLVYALLGSSMPRSGGDYVYNSRAINPPLGFMSNFVFTATVIGFIGVATTLFPSEFFNVFVATIGQMVNSTYLINSSVWFTTTTGEAITGTILIVSVGLLTLYGKGIWKFMRVIFVLVMVGSFVNIIFLLLTPHSVFLNAFNTKYPGEYNTIISTAKSSGWVPGYTVGATLVSLVYIMASFTGFNFSVYNGGEVKHASKNIPYSVMISLVVGGLMFALWALGIYNTFGFNFYSAANYLYNKGQSLPFIPTVNYLFTLIPQNPAVLFLGALGFGLAWIWLVPTDLIPPIRNIFAWSFDRILPQKFSYVSDRTHTPHYATIFVIIMGELVTLLFIYTSVSAGFGNTEILLNVTFLFTSIAAILFPFRAKKLYEQAPSFVQKKVFGFPLISIIGIYSTAIEIFLLYAGFSSPLIGGPRYSYSVIAGIILAGLVLYYVAKWYRMKKEGLDTSLAYKELPPE